MPNLALISQIGVGVAVPKIWPIYGFFTAWVTLYTDEGDIWHDTIQCRFTVMKCQIWLFFGNAVGTGAPKVENLLKLFKIAGFIGFLPDWYSGEVEI